MTSTSTTVKTARTYVRKAVARLRYDHEHPATFADGSSTRWLTGYDAEALMRGTLDEIDMLVPLLNDDMEFFTEELERKARDLARSLWAHRLAAKMADVRGRTPEEAEAFAAKVRELEAAR